MITDDQIAQRRMDLIEQMRAEEQYARSRPHTVIDLKPADDNEWMLAAGLLCAVAGGIVGYLVAGVCA